MKTKIYKPGNLNPLARKMLKDQRVSVVVENFLGVDWHQKTASTRRNCWPRSTNTTKAARTNTERSADSC